MHFFARDAGLLVLANLIRSDARNNGVFAEAPFAEMASRFGGSRTHVRNTLESAEAARLLEVRAQDGRTTILNDTLGMPSTASSPT
jgi:MarR-like DNA-binding transcriptional regulator SgrR of sgrS sRNA